MLSWSILKDIFFNEGLIFFAVIFFYNQISIIFIDKIRRPSKRLLRLNINQFITICAGIFYFSAVYHNWKKENVQIHLTEPDNTIIASVLLIYASSVVAFIIYIVYQLNPTGFIPRSEVFNIYKERELARTKHNVQLCEIRLKAIAALQTLSQSTSISTPINKLEERFGTPPHEYLTDRSSIHMTIYKFDADTLLVFHRDVKISVRGSAEYFNIYSFTNDSWQHLYDYLERPKNKKVSGTFYRIAHEANRKEIILQTLSNLHDHETTILKELNKQPTSLTVFPLSIIWYYVIMVMANGKIDYFIPVGRMAKTIIFFLSLFRLIVMGVFLSHIIKLTGIKT